VPVPSVPVPSTSVAFTRCPFRELATAYPDLVCQLHHGILEGILERRAGTTAPPVRIHAFRTLVDEDPCRVELATG
jgi:predicted ArsR family transcriptional regulator